MITIRYCPVCKSEDVRAEAYVQWEVGRQCWTIRDLTGDGFYCNFCDEEIWRIMEAEVDEENADAFRVANGIGA